MPREDFLVGESLPADVINDVVGDKIAPYRIR